jgi:HAD hydrolase, family IIB
MLCGMKFVEFKNLEELDNYGIKETTKCMLISEPDRIKEAEKHMKSKYENEYFIAISKPVFLEIANKNVNKGKTLRILGELTNIKMEEVIAVGDSYNDIPLLEVAGMPVAVSNANEEIKKISRFESTSNNDDALKTVIERFFE